MANVPTPKSTNDKSATKGSPTAWHPFAQFRNEIERMFDNAVPSFFDWPSTPTATLSGIDINPKVDVSETDAEYAISAELPGLDEKDVEISLADGMLTIKGEKSQEKEHKGDDTQLHWTERSYGSFRRSFRVPNSVDESKVSAEFKKGVLKISLPKSAEAQKSARKIKIKT